MEIMLDSGSSVSLIRQDIAKCLNGTTSAGDTPKLRLVSAGGEEFNSHCEQRQGGSEAKRHSRGT